MYLVCVLLYRSDISYFQYTTCQRKDEAFVRATNWNSTHEFLESVHIKLQLFVFSSQSEFIRSCFMNIYSSAFVLFHLLVVFMYRGMNKSGNARPYFRVFTGCKMIQDMIWFIFFMCLILMQNGEWACKVG